MFPGSKPLGLVFRCEHPTNSNEETRVVNFKSCGDTKGVAESCGRIAIGDCLTRLNGRAVLGKMPYRDIITTIKTFRARHGDLVPLVLHFRSRKKVDDGVEKKDDDDDAVVEKIDDDDDDDGDNVAKKDDTEEEDEEEHTEEEEEYTEEEKENKINMTTNVSEI